MKTNDAKRREPHEKKKGSLPDFSLWIREILKTSEEAGVSKPLALESGFYVVATPIGNLGDITLRALWVLQKADLILCEDTRVTGSLLAKFGLKKPLLSCHDHNEASRLEKVLGLLEKNQTVALVSDAGTPLISDPGYRLVLACREKGHSVFALPGASALMTALACAGVPTDSFLFVGFLPPKSAARRRTLERLQASTATLVFYESPQRIAACLEDMAKVFSPARRAVLCRELTKLFEEVKPGSLGELAAFYKEEKAPKGEVVLLVEPADENEAEDIDLDALLLSALKQMSLRDAVQSIAEKTGLKKSAIYERALTLSR